MLPDAWLDQFNRRLVQDTLISATADYWLRRAEAFEAAKPRPDEYHGAATPADLSEQWRRLDDAARACRARAKAAPFEDVRAEVDAALREVVA